jgi:hypothetical protein
MNRTILASLLLAITSTAAHAIDDLSPKMRAAIQTLQLGMTEEKAIAILRPLSLDHGRWTWGGTGSGQLYFRVSPTQQLRLEIGNGPEFLVTAIGALEPFGVWKRTPSGQLIVERSAQTIVLPSGIEIHVPPKTK